MVRVDNSRTPAMIKLRVKGSGNKQVWRAATDVVPVGLPHQARGQSVKEKAAPRLALDQPTTPFVSAQGPAKITDIHEPGSVVTAAATEAAVRDFAVGDRVLVSLDEGSPCGIEAKVVRVDNSRTPAAFKIRLKGRGKKEIWRAAADVVPIALALQAGGRGATGNEAGDGGVSERDATTTPVAEILPSTDPGSKGKPKADSRKEGKTSKVKQRVCPPLGDASAEGAIGRAAPTLDFQGGESKANHNPTDDGEGSVTLLAGESAGGQNTSSPQDNPAEKSTKRLAAGPRSHGYPEGVSNSARPVPSHAEPGRTGMEAETGTPEIGGGQRHQELQQQRQQQQKQKQQRKQQQQQQQNQQQQNQQQNQQQKQQKQQQQQRGEQPSIDASVVVPVGSDSAGLEVTVIEAQTFDSPSVRDSAKDRRMEGVRQMAEKLSSTTDDSAPTDQERGGDGPEQAQVRKSRTSSGTAENAAQRAPGKTLPRIRQDEAAGGGDRVRRGAPAVGTTRGSELGEYWRNPPPRKRAAATAAANAISSSRIRGVVGRRDGRESDSATKSALASKGRGATKHTSAGKVIKTPRKFGRGLHQRPKVVTPGSAQGRSEPALR